MPELWRGGMVVFASDVGALMGHKGGVGVPWTEAFARFAKRNMGGWTQEMDMRRQRTESRALEHVRRALTHDLDAPPHDGAALVQAKRRKTEEVRRSVLETGGGEEVARAAADMVASELNCDFGTRQEGGAIGGLERRTGSRVTQKNERTMYGPWHDLGAHSRRGAGGQGRSTAPAGPRAGDQADALVRAPALDRGCRPTCTSRSGRPGLSAAARHAGGAAAAPRAESAGVVVQSECWVEQDVAQQVAPYLHWPAGWCS